MIENQTNQKYTHDQAIVIGRFQPFHLGHLSLIREALEIAPIVKVLVGTPFRPRDIKNPFTFEERADMIYEHLPLTDDGDDRGFVYALEDAAYNDQAWIASVQNIVDEHPDSPKVALIGHKKDESSYYLDLFPQYDLIEIKTVIELDATTIREKMWKEDFSLFRMLPEPSATFVEQFMNTDQFVTLRQEHEFIIKYRQQWADAPYAPTFVTVDAVVLCKGHILVVERKAAPGEGLMALPGGFLKIDKTALDSVIEELYEETQIGIPENVIRGSIADEKFFDDPGRSLRGRTVTQAFLINLNSTRDLPRVRGGDDAKKASWITINEFWRNSEKIFEDHLDIAKKMISPL